jgi:hypothetical protein
MLEFGELLLWTVYPIGMLPIITSSEQHTDIAKLFKPWSCFALSFNNRVFLAGEDCCYRRARFQLYVMLADFFGQARKLNMTDGLH